MSIRRVDLSTFSKPQLLSPTSRLFTSPFRIIPKGLTPHCCAQLALATLLPPTPKVEVCRTCTVSTPDIVQQAPCVWRDKHCVGYLASTWPAAVLQPVNNEVKGYLARSRPRLSIEGCLPTRSVPSRCRSVFDAAYF